MMKRIVTGWCALILLVAAGEAAAGGGDTVTLRSKPLQLALADSLILPVNDQDKIRLKGDLQMIAREEVAGLKAWQRKKSPKVAVYSNMLLPGLGQVYNGRRFKTVLMVGAATFYMGKSWLHYKRSVIRKKERDQYPEDTFEFRQENAWHEFHKESAKDYLWWFGAAWIIGMLDAYIDAHLFDIRGYVPHSSETKSGYLTLSMSF